MTGRKAVMADKSLETSKPESCLRQRWTNGRWSFLWPGESIAQIALSHYRRTWDWSSSVSPSTIAEDLFHQSFGAGNGVVPGTKAAASGHIYFRSRKPNIKTNPYTTNKHLSIYHLIKFTRIPACATKIQAVQMFQSRPPTFKPTSPAWCGWQACRKQLVIDNSIAHW